MERRSGREINGALTSVRRNMTDLAMVATSHHM